MISLYDRKFRLIVIIWKPFKTIGSLFRGSVGRRTSLIDAFCTFFLLSHVKLSVSALGLLLPVEVYQLDSTGNLTHSWRLYSDATVPLFGTKHLPYAITAIAVLLLTLLPVLLLVFYPFRWFQKLLNLIPIRWHILRTFVDSFQGCYKDGTELGTRDCRWFASIFFILRLLSVIIEFLTDNSSFMALYVMVLTLVAILFVTGQPFKQNVSNLNCISTFFTLLLALLFATMGIALPLANEQHILVALSVIALGSLAFVLPLFFIPTIILRWMYRNRRLALVMISRWKSWRLGYEFVGQ